MDARVREGGEIASAALMAAATVASAWCAYQAALWSGDQLRLLATASAAQFASLRKTNESSAFLLIDVQTFFRYVEDEARGEKQTAQFIASNARPEFRPVLEAWIAGCRAGKKPAELPFAPDRYQLATLKDATKLSKEGEAAGAEANAANEHSDLFVMHTVVFALALFFLGSSSAAKHVGVRRAMLIMGALAFVLGVLSMARLPRAPGAPRRPAESQQRGA